MTGSQATSAPSKTWVTDEFGLPGGAILPTYDPLYDLTEGPPHPGPPREQVQATQLRATQCPAVRPACIATSGPGNQPADRNRRRKQGLHPAGRNHRPGCPRKLLGSDAFQEADIAGNGNAHLQALLHDHRPARHPPRARSSIPHRIHRSPRPRARGRHQGRTGRHDGIPRYSRGPRIARLHPVTRGHSKQIHEAAKYITESKHPVFYVGGGLVRAGASEEFHKLAKLIGAPVVTTLNAIGVFPDSGPPESRYARYARYRPAVAAMQKSDLLITLGARFDDRVTGKLDSTFAPEAGSSHVTLTRQKFRRSLRGRSDCRRPRVCPA